MIPTVAQVLASSNFQIACRCPIAIRMMSPPVGAIALFDGAFLHCSTNAYTVRRKLSNPSNNAARSTLP